MKSPPVELGSTHGSFPMYHFLRSHLPSHDSPSRRLNGPAYSFRFALPYVRIFRSPTYPLYAQTRLDSCRWNPPARPVLCPLLAMSNHYLSGIPSTYTRTRVFLYVPNLCDVHQNKCFLVRLPPSNHNIYCGSVHLDVQEYIRFSVRPYLSKYYRFTTNPCFSFRRSTSARLI